MSLLRVENLFYSIDEKQIFSDLSFSIEKGSLTIITGKNGSGKSQLLRCLKGLTNPKQGKIFLDEKDVTKAKAERLKSIALVFQDADIQVVGLTVKKDIAFGMENLGYNKDLIKEKTIDVTALLGLSDKLDQKPGTLSGGERRKLAIAGTLVLEPSIIFLDEPFANLDYPSTLTVLRTLVSLKAKGHTIVIVSHEVEKCLALSDAVILLDKGKLIYAGNSKDSISVLKNNEIYVGHNSFEEMTWL